MEKQAHNIQDVFLNHLRKEKLSVTIFLMGGVKLTGRIKSFDKFAVILESNHRDQLVFKHAIATVLTTKSAATGSAPPPLPTEAPSQAAKASNLTTKSAATGSAPPPLPAESPSRTTKASKPETSS